MVFKNENSMFNVSLLPDKYVITCNAKCHVLLLQPIIDVSTAAVLVPQQALDSLVPKPLEKKNRGEEPPKELGDQSSLTTFIYL